MCLEECGQFIRSAQRFDVPFGIGARIRGVTEYPLVIFVKRIPVVIQQNLKTG